MPKRTSYSYCRDPTSWYEESDANSSGARLSSRHCGIFVAAPRGGDGVCGLTPNGELGWAEGAVDIFGGYLAIQGGSRVSAGDAALHDLHDDQERGRARDAAAGDGRRVCAVSAAGSGDLIVREADGLLHLWESGGVQ